jgi:hypothetical protein
MEEAQVKRLICVTGFGAGDSRCRSDNLRRPGGGVGGHPGTVPPSRLLYGSAARSQAKRR